MRLSLTRLMISAALAALAVSAQADIYRCVNTDGSTSYSDKPCPQSAKSKSNITDSVGACTSAQCEEQRRQQADEARARLRAEKEELSNMESRRKRVEADYERERARLEELRYRQSIEDRLAALADQAAQGIYNPDYGFPGFPGYPVYPVIGRPCGRNCSPHPRPHTDGTKRPKEPSVRLRVDQ